MLYLPKVRIKYREIALVYTDNSINMDGNTI